MRAMLCSSVAVLCFCLLSFTFTGSSRGSSRFLQNVMVCRVRGAESNSEGPRFVR